jgi:hypothetical protein
MSCLSGCLLFIKTLLLPHRRVRRGTLRLTMPLLEEQMRKRRIRGRSVGAAGAYRVQHFVLPPVASRRAASFLMSACVWILARIWFGVPVTVPRTFSHSCLPFAGSYRHAAAAAHPHFSSVPTTAPSLCIPTTGSMGGGLGVVLAALWASFGWELLSAVHLFSLAFPFTFLSLPVHFLAPSFYSSLSRHEADRRILLPGYNHALAWCVLRQAACCAFSYSKRTCWQLATTYRENYWWAGRSFSYKRGGLDGFE